MKREFIPYEQALALQELGFNEPCFGSWFNYEDKNIVVLLSENIDGWYDHYADNLQVPSPLYQQAFRWFREKYKIGYNITWNKFYENTPYQWEVRKYWENEPTIPYGYAGMSKTYEEAELECLKKLIEIAQTH